MKQPFLLALLLLLSGCASLPENVNRSVSLALQDTDDTAIAHYLAAELASHPGQSGFHLLDDGLDAFVARAALAQAAERSLDVQYYLYHADLTGRLLSSKLIAAADRGVRVRILLDDMGLSGQDNNLLLADSHPNIELRIFNPFTRNRWRAGQFITRMGEVSRRMHNKSFTADNQLTIVGGRNIGNEYFNADLTLVFGDLDVLAAGPVVKEISKAFDAYWAGSLAYPITTLTGGQASRKQYAARVAELHAYVDAQKDSAYLKALENSAFRQKLKN
ncbi:MAG: phospholipase D family protein, partial [Gammaproteobacteria bacterium]|nr:phospholipase D family protein [Gammaproteobacteria bacterium]